MERIQEVEERPSVVDLPENFKSKFHKPNTNKLNVSAKFVIPEDDDEEVNQKDRYFLNDKNSKFEHMELPQRKGLRGHSSPAGFSEEDVARIEDPMQTSVKKDGLQLPPKKQDLFAPMQNKLTSKFSNSDTPIVSSSGVKEKPEERVSKKELLKAQTVTENEGHKTVDALNMSTPVKLGKKEYSERENSLDKYMEGQRVDSIRNPTEQKSLNDQMELSQIKNSKAGPFSSADPQRKEIKHLELNPKGD